MSTSKSTFVLVLGAWHQSLMYSTFLTRVHRQGYPAIITVSPSVMATDPSNADCQKDSDSIRQQILPLTEDNGQDIVMLCHSYGGIPGGGAAHGLSKSSRRKEGKKGGVIGLVYMTSFVVAEGESLLSSLGGKHAPFMILNQARPSQGLCTTADPPGTFFGDVDPKVAANMASSLLPHALKAFDSPAPLPAWAQPEFAGRLAFLKCRLDRAIPTFVQDIFTGKSGVEWKVRDMETSHSPWLSRPEETVKILTQWADEFQAMG